MPLPLSQVPRHHVQGGPGPRRAAAHPVARRLCPLGAAHPAAHAGHDAWCAHMVVNAAAAHGSVSLRGTPRLPAGAVKHRLGTAPGKAACGLCFTPLLPGLGHRLTPSLCRVPARPAPCRRGLLPALQHHQPGGRRQLRPVPQVLLRLLLPLQRGLAPRWVGMLLAWAERLSCRNGSAKQTFVAPSSAAPLSPACACRRAGIGQRPARLCHCPARVPGYAAAAACTLSGARRSLCALPSPALVPNASPTACLRRMPDQLP